MDPIVKVGKASLYLGNCLEIIPHLPDNSVDSVVTDPPYHLTSIVKRFGGANAASAKVGKTGAFARASRGFMGQTWDGGDIAFRPELWAEVLRVLKPGGHLAAFSGTRTYHRMAVAIEDAGFEIRDQLAWTYGSGFPKSHDVSKAIDKKAGHWRGRAGPAIERTIGQVAKGTEYLRSEKGDPVTLEAKRWQGWGTALKPAWEPICLARKPLVGTVAENVLAHGVGALNVDDCRVESEANPVRWAQPRGGIWKTDAEATAELLVSDKGRWPANILHDGEAGFGEQGRFFYCAKASKTDREDGNNHPTVKPTDLMRWLCRLITPPGGVVLDPFTGSGSTGRAALLEGMGFVGCELTETYIPIAERRMKSVVVGVNDNEKRDLFGVAV